MTLLVNLLEIMQQLASTISEILSWGFQINLYGQNYYFTVLSLLTVPLITAVLTLKVIKLIPLA